MNKLILSLGCAALLCLTLVGCSSQQKADDVMHDASEFSAVSVTDPSFKPQPGQSFAWLGPIIWASDAMPRDPKMVAQMTNLINQELMRRGYKVIEDQQNADYILGAAIADGESAQSEQVKSFFNLFPAIGNSRAHLKETTALVGVIHSKDLPLAQSTLSSRVVLWRSSLAAYVVGDKISPEMQSERLAVFSRKLMRTLP